MTVIEATTSLNLSSKFKPWISQTTEIWCHENCQLHDVLGIFVWFVPSLDSQGYEDLGDFIATQGPLTNTIGDFWWMIWEKRIPVLVMLTNLQEKGRVKSHCYWPSNEEKPEQVYDAITVVMESEAVMTHQTIRTFKISCDSRPEVRRVTQYHFTSWPDHGVPKSTRALLELVEYVRSMYRPDLGPVLVHCGWVIVWYHTCNSILEGDHHVCEYETYYMYTCICTHRESIMSSIIKAWKGRVSE